VDAPASSLTFQPFDRVSLLGVTMDRMELGDLRGWLDAAMASGRPHQVVTANLDFLAIARKNVDFARVVAAADLVVCDGKPLQWAAGMKSRVTGNDIVLQTARLSAARGYRLFLLGAYPGVADRAAQRLRELAPGAVIAGTYAPTRWPFTPEQDVEIVAAVQAARPHALFVALGAPRQDEWIEGHPDLRIPLSVGVGGAFNFLAGETHRAPLWMQRMGLEWTHRLISEPSRLWRRYLIDDLPLGAQLLLRRHRRLAPREETLALAGQESHRESQQESHREGRNAG
jgi:N-acetylglucosaminyldiphosphoundecaprenol N-acetyl-beta-D-mannosaminyltransferase